MGFFSRFADKIEEVNRGNADINELDELFTMDSGEAEDDWHEMEISLVKAAVNAVDVSAERAFIFVDFSETDPKLDLFYQMNGHVVHWQDLSNADYRESIENVVLPQAREITETINQQFQKEDLAKIAYAEIQFEWGSQAWFGHTIYEDNEEAKLDRNEVDNEWFKLMQKKAPEYALDSDEKLPWYPQVKQ
ncbi:hypothetical protein D3P96_07455 [Weissella viridescens]|uniref:DUF600 family protein n=1 Tax=Weissella viridescens TaxID=1629 RepID=A0A3P2RAI7_WEIVI|nr:hypothetical protein [Weissella viridescens]RRG17464.1 hypothetical protein D3P96_07455 [Weissella viridescens]